MSKKNITLFFVIAVILGSIFYLESQKPERIASDATDIILTDSPSVMTDNSETMPNDETSSSTTANLGAATTAKGTTATAPKPSTSDRSEIRTEKAAKYSRAKELAGIEGYINTPNFKLADLVGKKVILIDFWTYSCINCQRTIPYLKSWYEKYKDKGFVIVGVHTPEFEFEKNYDNVTKATVDLGVNYPVVLDNNYATWNAYSNRFWPREYLIDIDGFIVHDHIGEGGYAETEKAIQDALKERMEAMGESGNVDTSISKPSDAVTFNPISAISPETYFGSSRNEYLANGAPGKSGEQYLEEPSSVSPNALYLIGKWNIMPEYAVTSASVGDANTGSDRVDYRFHASHVYFVAGSGAGPIDVEVLVDSKPVDQSMKGADIFYRDGKSYITVEANKLYKLIEGKEYQDHLLELIISKPGLEAYAFTFG